MREKEGGDEKERRGEGGGGGEVEGRGGRWCVSSLQEVLSDIVALKRSCDADFLVTLGIGISETLFLYFLVI